MKGILFKPDMIKAIVEGRKTVTRRVIKPQPAPGQAIDNLFGGFYLVEMGENFPIDIIERVKPRYHVDETVYIKEAWRLGGYIWQKEAEIIFRSDGAIIIVPWNDWLEKNTKYGASTGDIGAGKLHEWRSPMLLLADFARYFIQITDVRSERLQEIENEPDGYKKEGYSPLYLMGKDGNQFEASLDFAWYENLWDTINPKYPYSSNPWVFRHGFKPVPKGD